MASSLDNHPTHDGFCCRSSDREVLGLEEYYTLDDFAEEGGFQFEDDDIMVEVLGSDVYLDGVCADGNVGDPKSSPRGVLCGSVEGFSRRPQVLASREESSVRVSEEGVAAKDGGAFSVSDLVWVKVEIHQWWPGRIADPSEDPSEKAGCRSKRDLFLVAYFGDRSFSWHEGSSLKPFIPLFPEAVMHRNSEVFRNAVDCALVEYSRRLQLGLTCPCLPKNVNEKIICPNLVNRGTTQVLGARDSADDFASARSFKPEKLLEYINILARFPFGEVDRLKLAVTKVQLSCFYRHDGYEWLPEVQCCRELMQSDGGEGNNWNDISGLTRKERSPAELMGDSVDSLDEASPSRKKHRIHDPRVSSCIEDGKKLISIAEDAGTSEFADSLASERSRNGECALLNGFEIFVSDSGHIRFPEESSPDGLFGQFQLQLEDTNDSYWTDRIIETNSQDQQYYHHDRGTRIEDSRSLRETAELSSSSIDGDCLVVDENSPAELVMQFSDTGRFPCEVSLNKTLKMFGPLKESETRVDRERRHARVVFRKFADAKVAFGSAQKYSIFGPVAVKYQLNCPISRDPSQVL